jgi:hypothetical protein
VGTIKSSQLCTTYYLAMQYTRHHQKLPDFATILSFIGNTT